MDIKILIVLLIIHSGLSILVGYFFGRQFLADDNRRKANQMFAFSLAFFIPVFGLLGFISIYLLYNIRYEDVSHVNQIKFDEHLNRDTSQSLGNMVPSFGLSWKQIKEVHPMIDTFKYSDVELQKGAVDALASKKDHESIQMLIDSMEYTEPEVRYFTVEALSKISKYYSDKITNAQELIEQNPNSIRNMMMLADCYFDYGKSDVEDAALSRYYVDQAIIWYKKILTLDNSCIETMKKLGGALKHYRRYEESRQVYEKALLLEGKNIHTLFNLAEIYFYLGKIKKVRAIANSINNSFDNVPGHIEKAISMWV